MGQCVKTGEADKQKADLTVAHEWGPKSLQQHQKQKHKSTEANVLRRAKAQFHLPVAITQGHLSRCKAGAIGSEEACAAVQHAAVNLLGLQPIGVLLAY